MIVLVCTFRFTTFGKIYELVGKVFVLSCQCVIVAVHLLVNLVQLFLDTGKREKRYDGWRCVADERAETLVEIPTRHDYETR